LADVKNLVGESKCEDVVAIFPARLKTNYAYFQVVTLPYDTWRYCKMTAHLDRQKVKAQEDVALNGVMNNLACVKDARLRAWYKVKPAPKHCTAYPLFQYPNWGELSEMIRQFRLE
jgi:hypothetical protein